MLTKLKALLFFLLVISKYAGVGGGSVYFGEGG